MKTTLSVLLLVLTSVTSLLAAERLSPNSTVEFFPMGGYIAVAAARNDTTQYLHAHGTWDGENIVPLLKVSATMSSPSHIATMAIDLVNKAAKLHEPVKFQVGGEDGDGGFVFHSVSFRGTTINIRNGGITLRTTPAGTKAGLGSRPWRN